MVLIKDVPLEPVGGDWGAQGPSFRVGGEALMVYGVEFIIWAGCRAPETRATEDSTRYWRRKVTRSFMWHTGRTWTEISHVRGRGGGWGGGPSLHIKPL